MRFAHIWPMTGRPCKPDDDFKRLWKTLMPGVAMPACEVTKNTGAASLAAAAGPVHNVRMTLADYLENLGARKAVLAYVAVAVATVIFQIWLRSGQCGDACGLSYAKGAVWSVIWPVYWVYYLRDYIY